MDVNCVIIGGGIIGLLTARELAAAGLRVTVVERTVCGQESSWAGGGILAPLEPWRLPRTLKPLLAWSRMLWPDLAAELHAETGCDPEWIASGCLVLDPSAEAMAWASREGADAEPVSGARLAELEPGLARSFSSAIWLPGVAQARNPRLLRAVRLSVLARGVNLVENVGTLRLLVRSGSVTGVWADGREIMADATIIAAGAWSGQIMAEVGLELRVRPVRGQMILYPPILASPKRILMHGDRYLVPRRDGRVLAGSTVEDVGFDRSVTADARHTLMAAAAGMIPALAGRPIERQWAGLRPAAPGGIPYICQVDSVPGLFVNTGHYRNGVTLAPASARVLTDLLLERTPAVDPRSFAYDAQRGDHSSAAGD